MDKLKSGLPTSTQEGTPHDQMIAILKSGYPSKLFSGLESSNILLQKLTAAEIIDGLLAENNVYDLLTNMRRIREQGFVDSNELVSRILSMKSGKYVEPLVRNLEKCQFGKLSDETYDLLDTAITHSSAREMIQETIREYKIRHERD